MKKIEEIGEEWFLLILASILAVVGLGKLLQSTETLSVRLVIGRAIVTVAIGMGCAYTLLVFYPDLNRYTLSGVAILSAVFGEQSIELLINKFINSKKL